MSLEEKLLKPTGQINLENGFYVAVTELHPYNDSLIRKRLKEQLTPEMIEERIDVLKYDLPRLQREGGISHLDAITRDHAVLYRRLWLLLGIKKKEHVKDHTVQEVQEGLANLKAFSPNLNDYENKEEIIRYVIERSSDPQFKSYYFSDNNHCVKENREELINSSYFKSLGINAPYSIRGKNSHSELVVWKLLGINKKGRYHTIGEVKKGLFDIGAFGPDLTQYATKEKLIESILEKSKRHKFKLIYFSKENPFHAKNIRLLAEKGLSYFGMRNIYDFNNECHP